MSSATTSSPGKESQQQREKLLVRTVQKQEGLDPFLQISAEEEGSQGVQNQVGTKVHQDKLCRELVGQGLIMQDSSKTKESQPHKRPMMEQQIQYKKNFVQTTCCHSGESQELAVELPNLAPLGTGSARSTCTKFCADGAGPIPARSGTSRMQPGRAAASASSAKPRVSELL